MDLVVAFEPRRGELHFLCNDMLELQGMVGEMFGSEQCEDCGGCVFVVDLDASGEVVLTCSDDDDPEHNVTGCGRVVRPRLALASKVIF